MLQPSRSQKTMKFFVVCWPSVLVAGQRARAFLVLLLQPVLSGVELLQQLRYCRCTCSCCAAVSATPLALRLRCISCCSWLFFCQCCCLASRDFEEGETDTRPTYEPEAQQEANENTRRTDMQETVTPVQHQQPVLNRTTPKSRQAAQEDVGDEEGEGEAASPAGTAGRQDRAERGGSDRKSTVNASEKGESEAARLQTSQRETETSFTAATEQQPAAVAEANVPEADGSSARGAVYPAAAARTTSDTDSDATDEAVAATSEVVGAAEVAGGGASAAEASTYDIGRRDAAEETDAPAGETTAAAEDTVAAAGERTVSGRDAGDVAVEGTAALNGETDAEAAEESAAHAADTAASGETSAAEERDAPTANFDKWIAADTEPETNIAERGKIDVSAGEVSSEENAAVDPYEETVFDDNSETIEADNTGGGEKANNEEETATTAEGGKSVASLDERESRNTQSAAPDDNATASRPPVAGKTDSASEETDVTAHAVEDRGNVEEDTEAAFLSPASAARSTFDEEVAGVTADQAVASSDEEGVPAAQPASFPAASTAAEEVTNERGRGKRLTAVNTDERGEKDEAAEEETSREEEGQEEGENNRHPHHQHLVENLEDWAVTEEASKQKLQERGDETPATEEQRPEWRAAAAAEPTDLPAELAARTATDAYTSSPGGELLEGSHGFPFLSRRNSERDSHEEESTQDLGEETIENLEDDDDWTEGASDEEEERETEHRGREKETETEEALHEKKAGEEGAKEEGGHELEEADREELERVEDGAGGEAEGTIVRDEEENATAGEWEEQEKHRGSEETEEKREEREAAGEEKKSGRVERDVEEMLARERETTLNAGTAAQRDQAQQQAEVQQANTGQEQQGGGEAAGEGHEETDEDTEDDETEEMEAESGKEEDETEEEEKRKEGLDGGGDEEDDERRKEAGFESPVNQDGSSAEEKVARGEQPEEDSYVEEAVQQVEKDGGEEALRRQATKKGVLLQAGGGHEEAKIGHTEVAQQQMDEQKEFSQNENKEQEESPANLQMEEQENAALMQGEELPERQEDWQREDGIQETEATDTLPKTDESEGGMTEERKNALRAFIRKQVEAENDLPGHVVEESEENKTRGEQAFLPDVGSQLVWQDKAEKQKTEAGHEQKGEAEVEGPVLETKGAQAGEREHHLLGAQETDLEKEAKPDKEQEKIEEDVKVEAVLRGEKEGQAQVGREDAERRTGKLSTEEEEVAEQEKDAEEQAAREARPDGEGEVQTEENAPDVLMQRQETKLTLGQQAARGHQRRADEVMQQLRGLISSLDALAKRFEEQQKQLKEKHQQEKYPEVYPPEDTEVQKQEQLLKESEERLPALLRKHEQLLGRLREERQRMLEGGDKTPGPLRGPVIGMGSSGEQALQHQHTEMLTAALANAAERFGTTIQQVNECCTAFVRDHDRALQVLYEYGRAVDLLNMGVRMNKLSEREIKERLRACTEAFSVLSKLLVTCDNRVASIMGLTRALEATQGLALARLEQAIEAQEHEEAGAATVGGNTAATELAPKKLQQQAGPRSDAQQTEEKQLLEAARQAVDVLERLGISVAEATRTVVNARAKWMEELSTQLLRHFDGLVKVGKQLRLREERRRRMELIEATKHTAGRHGRKSSWEDELHAHRTAFRADRHREPRRSWENQRMAGTSMFSRGGRGRRKTLPEKDRYYGDSEDDEKYKEDLYEIASQLAWKGFPERIQRRDRPFRKQLQPTFRRQAEEAAEQCYGRAQNHLLRDVNLEGWKAIQQMAEGAKVASKVARDTREAIEKEVSGDTTTAVLGALLGIALLLLLALVLYGYYMVFSYEERVNAYRIGNKAGQAIDKTDEGKATVAEKVKGRFTRERGSRRQAE